VANPSEHLEIRVDPDKPRHGLEWPKSGEPKPLVPRASGKSSPSPNDSPPIPPPPTNS